MREAMKKIFHIIKTLQCVILLLMISISCKSISSEEWLNSIFQCENDNGYCLPNDKDVFSERYYEFYLESLEIFEYPDFETEEEMITAEGTFRKKWKDIYPLDESICSPFSKGNGLNVGDKLENVTITHISDLEYSVLIEYRDGEVFSNNLLLVPSDDTFLIDYIATELIKQKIVEIDISYLGVDNILPIFMTNEANTMLYDEPSIESKIVVTLNEESIRSLIALTAVKDPEGNVWYKCFYPKEQVEGWTRLVSNWDFNDYEQHLLFLQNLTLANLQLGANPQDAERLLGKPQSKHAEKGPLEVLGYIDEEYIVTTTTMEYDGVRLIFQDDYLIHANITQPGESFGWITVADRACSKNFILEKFSLTEDNVYENEVGDRTIFLNWDILSLTVSLGADDLIEAINFHCGS